MPDIDDEDMTEEMAEDVRMMIMKPERYILHLQKKKEREDAEKANKEEKRSTCQSNQRRWPRSH